MGESGRRCIRAGDRFAASLFVPMGRSYLSSPPTAMGDPSMVAVNMVCSFTYRCSLHSSPGQATVVIESLLYGVFLVLFATTLYLRLSRYARPNGGQFSSRARLGLLWNPVVLSTLALFAVCTAVRLTCGRMTMIELTWLLRNSTGS